MKFFELNNNNKSFKKKLFSRLDKIIDKGQFILGSEVFKLENKLRDFVGSKYCITTSSGTDALLMALMACGIKKGDEVISSPFTFVSTIEVIRLLGATPVFVDIDINSFNIDENLLKKKITNKTKAIIAVSLFGQPANFIEINKIAKRNNLKVIEDAAQSFGSKLKNKYSCNLSSIGCTSFFPTKTLGTYGDGGACFTNSKKLATSLSQIRSHGQFKKYNYKKIGINGRLDTIQAGILLEKLKLFKKEISLRNTVAKRYDKLILNYKKKISPPSISRHTKSVYSQYSILLRNRKKTIKNFIKNKIPFAIYYPKPIYFYKPYNKFKCFCPVTEKVCEQIISIPMNPYLKKADQKKIINNLFEE